MVSHALMKYKLMKQIDEKEKLAILGFYDPPHSLAWYRENFENLPIILEEFIIDTIKSYGVFPKDANQMEKEISYHRYYLIMEHAGRRYSVKIINTDRSEISQEYSFKSLNEAAKFLIKKSYTTSGSIGQYWPNSGNFGDIR